MFTFGGKKLTPQEQAKKWKREMNKEVRGLDRQLRSEEYRDNTIRALIGISTP